MAAAAVLAIVAVALACIVAGRVVHYNSLYATYDAAAVARPALQAEGRMRTGDLLLFVHNDATHGFMHAIRQVSLSPFSHAAVVVQDNGTRVAEVQYGMSRTRDTVASRIADYDGRIYWLPLTAPLDPAEEARLVQASRVSAAHYLHAVPPLQWLTTPRFHCFEYVTSLYEKAGVLYGRYSQLLASSERIARAAVYGERLLVGRQFRPLRALRPLTGRGGSRIGR